MQVPKVPTRNACGWGWLLYEGGNLNLGNPWGRRSTLLCPIVTEVEADAGRPTANSGSRGG